MGPKLGAREISDSASIPLQRIDNEESVHASSMANSLEHLPSKGYGLDAPSLDDNDEDGFDDESSTSETEVISTQQRLLSSTEDDGPLNPRMAENGEEPRRSQWHLLVLTLCMFGVQFAWSTEFAQGTPYLEGLGLSKAVLSFVWIAGPLSGSLVQPYVGIRSDRCRSRFGRRRPFIVGGAVASIISYFALAWSGDIVNWIFALFGASKASSAILNATRVFAVLSIYVLDFSINVMQAGVRAFIVDDVPTSQQDSANAWASRVSGVGAIVANLLGFLTLPQYFWFFGNTDFKVLVVLLSFFVSVTVAISCTSVQERDSRFDTLSNQGGAGPVAFVKMMWRSARNLPLQVKRICYVQFFAWIGWFPILFYTTAYIGRIFVDPLLIENPEATKKQVDEQYNKGTRIGSFAMFAFSLSALAGSIILPLIVAKPASTLKRRFSVRIPGLTLRNAWLLSHLLFALLTWLTLAARTTTSITILIALLGISWAMTQWAPFALIATEISKRDANRQQRASGSSVDPPPRSAPGAWDSNNGGHGDEAEESTDQAGVVLGLHNVAIAAPQVVASLVSSAMFKALQKPRDEAGDDSYGWVIRFGGVCALAAAVITLRVSEESAK